MYSNVRMCKNQNQFGVKKSLVLLQCFHSLVISAIQNEKTKMWLKCRTMNRHFVLFFFFCGSANVLISREKMGSKGRYVCCGRVIPAWLNPELPLAPPRAFPGFCACREQQKCSNDNTGIAKLLGDFLFSPICEDSSALSCPGAGCSWPQGASAGRRDLLHWFAENQLSEFICKKKCPQLLKGRAWFQGGEGLWIASFSEREIGSTDLQPPIRCSVGHLFLKSWPIPRVSSKRKWWE